MKILIRLAVLLSFIIALTSCRSIDQDSDTQSGVTIANGTPPFPVDVSIERPTAGKDYPTDVPRPDMFRKKKILIIKDSRILVEDSFTLSKPKPGVDYPTDAPMPVEFRGRSILVLDGQYYRLPLLFAIADQGTKAKISLWVKKQKIDITTIASIERAVAGVDVPTDTNSVAYVIVLRSGKRIRI